MPRNMSFMLTTEQFIDGHTAEDFGWWDDVIPED